MEQILVLLKRNDRVEETLLGSFNLQPESLKKNFPRQFKAVHGCSPVNSVLARSLLSVQLAKEGGKGHE
jgi:hypothetical protein